MASLDRTESVATEELKRLMAFTGLKIVKLDITGPNIVIYCKYRTRNFQITVGLDGSLTLTGDIEQIMKVLPKYSYVNPYSTVTSTDLNIPSIITKPPENQWYTGISSDNTNQLSWSGLANKISLK